MMKAIAFLISAMIVLAGLGFILQNQQEIMNGIDNFNNKLRLLSPSQTPAPYVPPVQPVQTSQVNVSQNNTKVIVYNIYPPVPGDALTSDTSIICVSGYSASVRSVSQSKRERVFARDEVPYPQPTRATELDHLISLELGGSNEESNLWVSWSDDIVGDGWGYESKDKVENALHDLACSGVITMEQAQQAISTNWTMAYAELKSRGII